jgi:hypothetical protein
MSNSVSNQVPRPLELERVQGSRAHAGEIRLRLSGRWVDTQAAISDDEELLVINVEGRRHRFAADPAEEPDPELPPDRWSATFTVPSWAEPREEGQAALWLGTAVIPVPPLRAAVGPPAAPTPPGPVVEPLAAPAPPPPVVEPPRARPLADARLAAEGGLSGPKQPDAPRSGPLADLLLKETVAALQAEIEERTADAARARARLASVQSELDTRLHRHGQLETTLRELRDELDRLRAAVQDQRRELQDRSAEAATLREQIRQAQTTADARAAEVETLRADLAAANVAREAATNEVAGLRTELGRIGSELAVTQETVRSDSGDLGDATRLLEEAKALSEELRSQHAGG